MTRLDTSLEGLTAAVIQLQSDMRAATAKISEFGRTDWRAVFAAAGATLTFATLIGSVVSTVGWLALSNMNQRVTAVSESLTRELDVRVATMSRGIDALERSLDKRDARFAEDLSRATGVPVASRARD